MEKEEIYFCSDGVDMSDYFLVMPQKANDWDNVDENFEALLHSTAPKDVALVMDVIQQLLDTPVEDRFSEKKYRLRWIDDGDGGRNYLDNDDDWWSTEEKSYAKQYTESELEQLKKDNPRLAPAIDAMKEPVEGKDNED